MTKFPIPNSPAKKILDIDNFNGVDFTGNTPDVSRSNNACNIIKRNGFHCVRKAITQYVTSENVKKVNAVGIGSVIGNSELLIAPSNSPEQITNEEFREKYPNYQEGKIVIGNELGNMFVERNNGAQYGLFYVAPTSYGPTEIPCIGYEMSKNLISNSQATSKTINGVTFTVGDDKTSIHAEGTATTGIYYYLFDDTNMLSLNVGRYTLSAGGILPENSTVVVRMQPISGPEYAAAIYGNKQSVSFDIAEGTKIESLRIYVPKNKTINFTYNIQIEKGDTATDYVPYKDVDDDGYVEIGNVIADVTAFSTDQWMGPITILAEGYETYFYKLLSETVEQGRIPKLVDKITGELWEETSNGYHKVTDEQEMYLKISSHTVGDVLHRDFFQVFANASLLDIGSNEVKFETSDFDRENNIVDHYKKVMFNDKPHYFTATGIYTVEAKQIKKLDGTINIEIECTELGSIKYPAYTPLYRIGCNPELTKFTQNKDINLINHMVEVGYLSDGTSTNYKLMYNHKNYMTSEEVIVKILQADGTWNTYGEHDNFFSIDTSGDYVVFNTAPSKSPVDGVDNVIIKQRYGDLNLKEFTFDRKIGFGETSLTENTNILENTNDGIGRIDFAKDPYIIADGKIIRPNDTVDNPYPNGKAWYWETYDANHKKLYKYRNKSVCPAQMLIFDETFTADITEEEYTITRNVKNLIIYGNENEKRLFINGDKNIQVYSDANDITYWPSSNYNVIGDESDICGFGLSNGYLLTFKKGNNSIFVQQGATINNKTTFPIVYSQTSNNVVSEPIQLDDSLYVFTKDGLQEIAYSANSLIMVNRSYFVDNKLKNMNFDTLIWCKWDNKLYFMLNDNHSSETHIFVADLDDDARVYEKSSSVGNSFSTGIAYQYEWYYLKTILKPMYLTDYKWQGYDGTEYYLAYNNNGLYEIKVDDSGEIKSDAEVFVEGGVPLQIFTPIRAHWETPLIDMNTIVKAKTIRGVYINAISKPNYGMFMFTKTIDDGYNRIGEYYHIDDGEYDFTRRIYIKDKVRKFMNIKYLISNQKEYDNPTDTAWDMGFNRLSLEYQDAGKYRGA